LASQEELCCKWIDPLFNLRSSAYIYIYFNLGTQLHSSVMNFITLAHKIVCLPPSTVIINFQASCIDSTAQPEAVFAAEVKKLQADKLKPQEQITLEPYERDHAVVVGVYRPPPKSKGG